MALKWKTFGGNSARAAIRGFSRHFEQGCNRANKARNSLKFYSEIFTVRKFGVCKFRGPKDPPTLPTLCVCSIACTATAKRFCHLQLITDTMTLSVDGFLAKIGSMGRFQWTLVCVVGIMLVPVTFQTLIMTFLGLEPPWKCVHNSTVCNFTRKWPVALYCSLLLREILCGLTLSIV